MQTVLPIFGAIEGVTAYATNKAGVNELVARNETVHLPEVTRVAVEQKMGGGSQEMPTGLIDSMETSISKNGLGKNAMKYILADKIEYRFVAKIQDTDGTERNVGCKAMLTTKALTLQPSTDVEVGSNIEGDITKKVLTYTLYVDGEEMINVNKITGACKICGEDFGVNDSLL